MSGTGKGFSLEAPLYLGDADQARLLGVPSPSSADWLKAHDVISCDRQTNPALISRAACGARYLRCQQNNIGIDAALFSGLFSIARCVDCEEGKRNAEGLQAKDSGHDPRDIFAPGPIPVGNRSYKRDREPKTCPGCGRVLRGAQGLKVHLPKCKGK